MTQHDPSGGPVRFSQSGIWTEHRAFYTDLGIKAWTEARLPTLATTSAAMAQAYADMLIDWAELAVRRPDAPVYIIELGGGHGRLAAQVVWALARRRVPDTPRVVYVLTDLSERNIAAWEEDPVLSGLADEGALDFAHFDLEAPQALRLRRSGALLSPGGADNPVGLVANYLLDCVPCDLFHTKGGETYEVRATYAWDERQAAWRFTLYTEDEPVSPSYYGDPLLDGLLRSYAEQTEDAWPLVPGGALLGLRWLAGLSPAGALLLCTDKALRTPAECQVYGAPFIVTHGRSISVQANFHAVEALFVSLGGVAMHARASQLNVTSSAFCLGLEGAARARAERAFRRTLDLGGPADLYRLIEHHLAPPADPVERGLTLLRLSGYDPATFVRLADELLQVTPGTSLGVHQDLLTALGEVERRALSLAGIDHLHFHLGRVYFAAQRVPRAEAMFRRSLEEDGDQAATRFNLHAALHHQGRLAEAIVELERALALDPGLAAGERLAALRAELAGQAPPA